MRRQKRAAAAWFAAALLALVLFAWLSSEVLRGGTARLDASVRDAIHASGSPRLTGIMRGVTLLGSPPYLIALGILLAWRLAAQGRRRAALIFVVAALGAEALDALLKLGFHRPRPESFFGYAQPSTYSFPSGHSVVSCCFYGVAAAVLTARIRSRAAKAAIWTAAALLSLAIGFSRIYLGVHYLSDVLAGFAAAVVWVAAVRGAYEIWRRRGTGI